VSYLKDIADIENPMHAEKENASLEDIPQAMSDDTADTSKMKEMEEDERKEFKIKVEKAAMKLQEEEETEARVKYQALESQFANLSNRYTTLDAEFANLKNELAGD